MKLFHVYVMVAGSANSVRLFPVAMLLSGTTSNTAQTGVGMDVDPVSQTASGPVDVRLKPTRPSVAVLSVIVVRVPNSSVTHETVELFMRMGADSAIHGPGGVVAIPFVRRLSVADDRSRGLLEPRKPTTPISLRRARGTPIAINPSRWWTKFRSCLGLPVLCIPARAQSLPQKIPDRVRGLRTALSQLPSTSGPGDISEAGISRSRGEGTNA